MEVDTADERDIEAWLVLAREVEALFGPMVGEPAFLAALDANIARGSAYCVREGGSPTGTGLRGGLLFSQASPRFEITWLAVAEASRRQGIGRALVAHVAGLVGEGGELTVTTFGPDSAAGQPARSFFDSLGFRPGEAAVDGPEGGSRQVFRRRAVDDVVRRRVARVILLDDRDRVLLFFARDRRNPADSYWYLPGGGMDATESPQDAVRRELREEAGIEAVELGAVVHRSNGVTFIHEGRHYEQDEWQVVGWLPDGHLGSGIPGDPEGEAVAAHKWWSLDELDRSQDRIYPADLPRIVRALPPRSEASID